jgi:hypothetical protein
MAPAHKRSSALLSSVSDTVQRYFAPITRLQFWDGWLIPSSTSSYMESEETKRTYRRTLFDALCVAVLIAYFLHFALPALRGGFREDEMMNMGICWCAGALKSLLANIVFWKLFLCLGDALYYLPLYLYRPGGALYYLPLYHFFGLNPLPYRIAQISILAVSIPVVYYLSRRFTSSRSIAFLAVLALCYHPRLAGLVFVGAFIYDVLCGFFYFAAFAYYMHIRERGDSLRPLHLLGFLALYMCALNCKEMAVTLPAIVLIYEFLKSRGWANWKAFLRWILSYLAPSLIAGLLTVFYIYGKTHGGGSLASLDPYRPKYSWHNFTDSNSRFVGELLFAGHTITTTTLLILWAFVFIYAFVRRDRMLQLMAFWIVIVPLPLAFIVPIRGDAPLYLLLFGWAMIFAKVAFDLITLISKLSVSVGNRILATATGATLGDPSSKVSRRVFRIMATLLVALALAAFTQRENQRLRVPWFNVGAKTSHVIHTFRSLGLHPMHGSRILLLLKENLFQNKWNAFFIASLVWNDHSLRIWVESVDELTPQQQANADYIISLSEFSADVIREPELPKSD